MLLQTHKKNIGDIIKMGFKETGWDGAEWIRLV
jgi:hypothetical protein